jgi:hypothetical protein
MTNKKLILMLIALVAIFVLAACGEDPTPIYVYVTPTQPEAATDIAVLPTVSVPIPSETETPTPTIPPNATFGAIVGPNVTVLPTTTPAPQPGVTYGPIVGPNHTLVPTETRIPATLPPTVIPTAGPSPTPMPGLRRDLMGIQIHPHIDNREFDRALNMARELNVSWIKFQFNWSLLESSSGQYTELFYMLRLYVQQAHDAGFHILISVAKAPGWSRSADADGQMREDGPPNDPQTLATFLSGMLTMIGKDGQGQPYISAIEVWNEPNLQREWYGHPLTGSEYMRYFRPAFDAIRAYSADITVITAAPAPTGDGEASSNDRTWLQQLYDGGLAQYGQNVVVGIHPYGWANAPDARCCASPSLGWDNQPQFFFLDTIEDYHTIMVNNGHSNTQMWVTEFGWATFDGLKTSNGNAPANPADAPYFGFINQGQQADYTLRAFQLAQERPYLGPMILWNLNFSTVPSAVENSDPQTGYALVDSLWNPRPVYQYLKQAPKN